VQPFAEILLADLVT